MKHSITKLMLLLAVILCSIGANATYYEIGTAVTSYIKNKYFGVYPNCININGVTIAYHTTLDAFSEYPHKIDAIDIIEIWDHQVRGFDLSHCTLVDPENTNWGGEDFIDGKATTIRFPEYVIINGTKYRISVGYNLPVHWETTYPMKLIFEGPVAIHDDISATDKVSSITMPLGSEIMDCRFANCKNLTAVNFTAPTVDYVIKTIVHSNAFANCSNLTTLTFPESIGTASNKPIIEAGAFENCRIQSLTMTNVIANKGAFNGCPLKSLTLKGNDDKNYSCFAGLSSLESVTLSGTTYIHNEAFQNCTNLTTVTGASSVKIIGSYAFAGCTKLTSLSTFALTDIYDSAFEGCSALTYCGGKGSYALQHIYDKAFKGCSSLTGQFILDNCTRIGKEAFSGCTDPDLQLTGVNLDECRPLAFYNCAGTLSTESTSTGTCGINNSPFYGSLFTTITANKLTSVSDNYYFNNMPMLETINCQKLTSINSNWFAACPQLKNINVNNNNLRSSGTPTDGYAIYNGDYTTLLYAPQGVSRVVVDSRCNLVDATKFGRCIKQINAKGQVITFCPVHTLDFSNTDQEVTLYNPESSTLFPPTIKIPYGKRDLFASFTSDEVRVGEALEPIGVITDYIKGDVNEDAVVSNADAQGVYQEMDAAE